MHWARIPLIRQKKKKETQLISISESGAVRRDPSRQPLKKLRSFYSIETETLSLLSPLKRLFPFLLPPSLLSPFSLSPSLSSLMQVYFRWKSLGHSLPRLHSHWQTHCTTCPNSIINYYSAGEQLDPGFLLVGTVWFKSRALC